MIAGNSIANLATANKFTTQASQKEKPTPALHDRCGWFQPSALRRANAAAVNGSAWRLVLLGAPGVGKGTQADLLKRQLEACHLSTGDLFRAASKQKDVEPSPAMQVALEYMRRGELVPDSTVWQMVCE